MKNVNLKDKFAHIFDYFHNKPLKSVTRNIAKLT